MKKFLAIAALALLASACENAPATPNYPAYSYGQLPLRLAVREIQVVNPSQPAPNDVSNDFPIAPATAVQQWANSRLQAIGGGGVLVVTINEASAKEIPLPKTDGIKGFFTDQQDAKYESRINVSFALYQPGSTVPEAGSSAEVYRARSINEKATLNDRQQFQYTLTRDVMLEFDRQADQRIRQYFATYLR